MILPSDKYAPLPLLQGSSHPIQSLGPFSKICTVHCQFWSSPLINHLSPFPLLIYQSIHTLVISPPIHQATHPITHTCIYHSLPTQPFIHPLQIHHSIYPPIHLSISISIYPYILQYLSPPNLFIIHLPISSSHTHTTTTQPTHPCIHPQNSSVHSSIRPSVYPLTLPSPIHSYLFSFIPPVYFSFYVFFSPSKFLSITFSLPPSSSLFLLTFHFFSFLFFLILPIPSFYSGCQPQLCALVLMYTHCLPSGLSCSVKETSSPLTSGLSCSLVPHSWTLLLPAHKKFNSLVSTGH